jgi:hypothetical protein
VAAEAAEAAAGFKPIPDEEGTETLLGIKCHWESPGFKPIPDEEGTETA